MPGLLVAISSDRNRFGPEGAMDGDGVEVADGEVLVAEEVDIGGGWTRGVAGIKEAGTAMVTYENKFKSIKPQRTKSVPK